MHHKMESRKGHKDQTNQVRSFEVKFKEGIEDYDYSIDMRDNLAEHNGYPGGL
jgi:translation initiation factor IF-3